MSYRISVNMALKGPQKTCLNNDFDHGTLSLKKVTVIKLSQKKRRSVQGLPLIVTPFAVTLWLVIVLS